MKVVEGGQRHSSSVPFHVVAFDQRRNIQSPDTFRNWNVAGGSLFWDGCEFLFGKLLGLVVVVRKYRYHDLLALLTQLELRRFTIHDSLPQPRSCI
jgi:hypothetical protein